MRRLLAEFAVIVGCVALGAAFTVSGPDVRAPWARAPLPDGHVRLAEARELDPLWIDARSREAYEERHIPGAILLDAEAWHAGLQRLTRKWRGEPLVVYCDSSACAASERIAERLRRAMGGNPDIRVLHGGWERWVEAN